MDIFTFPGLQGYQHVRFAGKSHNLFDLSFSNYESFGTELLHGTICFFYLKREAYTFADTKTS